MKASAWRSSSLDMYCVYSSIRVHACLLKSVPFSFPHAAPK